MFQCRDALVIGYFVFFTMFDSLQLQKYMRFLKTDCIFAIYAKFRSRMTTLWVFGDFQAGKKFSSNMQKIFYYTLYKKYFLYFNYWLFSFFAMFDWLLLQKYMRFSKTDCIFAIYAKFWSRMTTLWVCRDFSSRVNLSSNMQNFSTTQSKKNSFYFYSFYFFFFFDSVVPKKGKVKNMLQKIIFGKLWKKFTQWFRPCRFRIWH